MPVVTRSSNRQGRAVTQIDLDSADSKANETDISNEKSSRDNGQERELDDTPASSDYIYTPTERHIFAPSRYKDDLLPLWRFKDPIMAQTSAEAIQAKFHEYSSQDDFVGMDNARKFLQMGMTRAARYANWKGGRKYLPEAKSEGQSKAKAKGQPGSPGKSKAISHPLGRGKMRKDKVIDQREEDDKTRVEKQIKRQASDIFRDYWIRAKTNDKYEAMIKDHQHRHRQRQVQRRSR